MIIQRDYQNQLSDYIDLPPSSPPQKEVLWDRFKKQDLYIDIEGIVKIESPFCPDCGRKNYNCDGMSKKRTHDIIGERFYFVCQRYFCQTCRKPFSAYIKHIIVYDEEMVHEKITVRLEDKISKISSTEDEMFHLGDKVISLLDDVLYSHLSLQMSPQAHYNKNDIINLVVRNSIDTTFLETTRNLLDIGPQFVRYPSADTVLLYIGKKKLKEIRQEFKGIFQYLIQKYKDYQMLSEPIEIAVDIHDKGYYGKQRTAEVCRGKAKNATTYFHKYVAVDRVGDGESFTLTAEHISMFDDMFGVCINSLEFVKNNGIEIKRAYFDRGFFNRKITDYLIDNDISFVMPAVKNDKVWRLANKN